jgi:predicted metal-dependent peptidase
MSVLDIAVSEKNDVKITNEEWFEISSALEPHHAVFYKVWQMGKPIFNEEISTAAVQFDEEGKFVLFYFNPKFWKSLDLYNRLFVICHEALHIVLNHGIRSKDDKINRQACNTAMDIVVNHTLIRNFGFERNKITNGEEYCWVDTVFKDHETLPPSNNQFEFYYNLFEKFYGDGNMGDGEGGGPKTVDDHESMGEKSGNWNKFIDQLNNGLSDEEKESLKSTVDKHFQKEPPKNDNSNLNSPAGSNTGGLWTFASAKKYKKIRKWETVIKKWAQKRIIESYRDVEQWARTNRRMTLLPKEMILPSEMEVDERDYVENKIDVWFFLDTSGSCWTLKDRFFAAAESLPEKRFNVRLFCFDTNVQETNLKERKIYGGGGTSFSIIEQYIQRTMQNENVKYPNAVWILTDGYGNQVKPLHPEKWHWFLTDGGVKNYIDEKSNVFSLKDFE